MNNHREVIIIGAGGHCKVVLSTLLSAGYTVKGLLDEDQNLWGKSIFGYPILGDTNKLHDFLECSAILALGCNSLRKQIAEKYSCEWITVVHPKAVVHESVKIGIGTVVFAGVIIQPDTVIGKHCIINTGATVDHDCFLHDYVHLCPGVHLAGGVSIDEGCMLGVGSSVIPGIQMGRWTVAGAGSVIVDNFEPHSLVKGVPAKVTLRVGKKMESFSK